MARADEFQGSVTSPVKKYILWDSDNKCFRFWDKEAKKNELIKLPFKLIYLTQRATIKGFNKATNSGIYSNEINFFDLKKEELDVRTFGKKHIAKGVYSNIKGEIDSAGGRFATSLYAFVDGEVVNVTLVGASYSAWYDFNNNFKNQFNSNYISVESTIEKKKGRTTYFEPVFTIGDAIKGKASLESDDAYDNLVAYLKARGKGNDNLVPEVSLEQQLSNNDSLPKFREEPVALEVEGDVLPF